MDPPTLVMRDVARYVADVLDLGNHEPRIASGACDQRSVLSIGAPGQLHMHEFAESAF
jgi:hypothetical protein